MRGAGAALIALGCHAASEDGALSSEPERRAAASLPGSAPDPCAIALTPTPPSSITVSSSAVRIAREVERDQARVRAGGALRSIYLERLGWSYIDLARASFDPGFHTMAEQVAQCILQTDPDDPKGLRLQGHVLYSRHRFAEAESLARRLTTGPALPDDYALLGDALLEQGDVERAVQAYQSMMDLKPGPAAYARAAHVRWLTGDLPGAIDLLETAAAPAADRNLEAMAWIRVRLAEAYFRSGKNDRAEHVLDNVLGQLPDYAPALLLQGRMLLAKDAPAGATRVLTRAAELQPTPEVLWTLLEALETGQEHERRAEVAAILNDRGGFEDPRTYSLFLATRGSSPTTARELAERELEVRADVFTLDAVAWAAHASGDTPAAKEHIGRALRTGTPDARLFLHAAIIAESAGDKDDAHRHLLRAAELHQMLLPSETRLLKELAARVGRPLS